MSTADFSDRMKRIRFFQWMICSICLIAITACQSDKGMYKPGPKDPFAENAPKSKEEEAYYQDVHSGEWKEQTNPFGFAKSIGKKNGSLEMPPHWAMIPPGAKSMSELKAEKRAREDAQAAVAMNYTPVNPAPMQGTIPGFVPNAGNSSVPMMPNGAPMNGYPVNNGYNPQMVPGSVPMQMNNGVPQGVPQYQNPYPQNPMPQTQYPYPQNPQAVPNSQIPSPQGTAGAYYPQGPNNNQGMPVYNPNLPNNNPIPTTQAPAPVLPQGSTGPANQPPVPIPGMDPSQTGSSGPQAGPGTLTQKIDPLKNKELYPSIKAPGAVLGDKTNRIVRGQMPVDPSLRSRMREAYFQDQPLRIAFAQNPGTPNPASSVKSDPAEKPAEKLTPDPSLRIGGKVLPLKIDPKLADRWKNAEPLPPLEIPQSAPYEQKGALPSAEYITDGGDKEGAAYSDPDWNVHHLEVEDTIAHFDTVDGQILVEPSNEVKIYSPRFGSVRQILLPKENESRIVIADTRVDLKPLQGKDVLGIDIRSQDESTKLTQANRDPAMVNNKLSPEGYGADEFVIEQDQLIKLGDFTAKMKTGLLTMDDRAFVVAGSAAAKVWGQIQRVEVDIDSYRAQVNVWDSAPEALYTIDTGTKSSKLKLTKIASKSAAQPGELVEFVLRFENIGNQPIGNITILDNLTPRLEYVDNSARSSLKGEFLSEKNKAGSQILRWEITDPLPKGAFGVIQFVCRVR
ncbi:MAG: hypothetical protein Q4G69_13125 [Planctomycetia bacterium]|nr:hypothetical protein [Planctomycetia bacterium]